MATFRILFGIDALAAAVVAFFFVWGLSDGSVSAFNILLWLALLGGVGVVLGGGLWLERVWTTPPCQWRAAVRWQYPPR